MSEFRYPLESVCVPGSKAWVHFCKHLQGKTPYIVHAPKCGMTQLAVKLKKKEVDADYKS